MMDKSLGNQAPTNSPSTSQTLAKDSKKQAMATTTSTTTSTTASKRQEEKKVPALPKNFVPGDHDVVVIAGDQTSTCTTNPKYKGNEWCRRLIMAELEHYQNSTSSRGRGLGSLSHLTKKDETAVVKRVVGTVLETSKTAKKGGRFVKQDPKLVGRWILVADKQAQQRTVLEMLQEVLTGVQKRIDQAQARQDITDNMDKNFLEEYVSKQQAAMKQYHHDHTMTPSTRYSSLVSSLTSHMTRKRKFAIGPTAGGTSEAEHQIFPSRPLVYEQQQQLQCSSASASYFATNDDLELRDFLGHLAAAIPDTVLVETQDPFEPNPLPNGR